MANQEEIRQADKYGEYTHRARSIRDMEPGRGRANVDKQGRVVGESTHKMRTEYIDDRWVSFPTLFPHKEKPNRWTDYADEREGTIRMAYDEAGTRGERFEFGQDKKAALKFGEGSWKPK